MQIKLHKSEDPAYKRNTHDKDAALCLFYNLAADRINNLLSVYEKKEIRFEAEIKGEIDYSKNYFGEETYLQLKVYLWKEELSSTYSTLSPEDVEMVNMFLYKLNDIRNFQSHYYHDAEALSFPKKLSDVVTNLFERAKNKLADHQNFNKYLNQLEKDIFEFTRKDGSVGRDVHKHFNFFENGYICEEGKNFFLSFFLLKSEMNKFLKKRKWCKKDNGEKYQVKTMLFTTYCHRDGSNRFFLNAKAEYLPPKEELRRQHNTILNYLKSQPIAHSKYIPHTKEMPLYSNSDWEIIKEARNQNNIPFDGVVARRKNRFLEIAIRYFMDMKNISGCDSSVHWQVENLDFNKRDKQNIKPETPSDKSSYFTSKSYWHTKFIKGFFPVLTNKHVKFKLEEDGEEYAIGEREIKNWLYFLLNDEEGKTIYETINAIKAYGTEYKIAINELVETDMITFDNYPLVFDKGMDSIILSEMHKKIIEGLQFDIDIYRQKIIGALASKQNLINYHIGQKNNYTRYRKNRVVIECFNWFLPLEAKLKPDETNKLSIYNLVSENKNLSKKTRESIIIGILHKLEKAKNNAFREIESAANLNDLFMGIISLLQESINDELKTLYDRDIAYLHSLAAKLGVSLPGVNVSRVEGKNRKEELKTTIKRKPILLPNGVFARALAKGDREENISAKIASNNNWKNILIAELYNLEAQEQFVACSDSARVISKEVLQHVSKFYDSIFKELDGYKEHIFKALVDAIVHKHGGAELDRQQIADALNLKKRLREIEVQDALLGQIFYKYHDCTIAGIKDDELITPNLASLFDAKYALKIGDVKIELEYKQLDDLSTHWNRTKIEKLLKNNQYWSEDFLARMDKEKKSMQQKIILAMDSIWQDSFYYIKTILAVERKIVDRCSLDSASIEFLINNGKQKKQEGMARINLELILKQINGITKDKIVKFKTYRDSAFHTDIPLNNVKYEVIKNELALLADIKVVNESDRKKYNKTKLE